MPIKQNRQGRWFSLRRAPPLILLLTILGLFVVVGLYGQASATLEAGNPNTTNTPGLGENVSDCGGQTPPGNPAVVACQTESIDYTTYYELWEKAPRSAITLKVSYTCATGYESFQIYSVQGSINSGQTDYSGICDGYALSQGINKSPNKYDSEPAGSITVTPASTDCGQYASEYCEAVIEVKADNPASPSNATSPDNPENSPGFYGGNVQVGFTVTSGNADIMPANDTEPGTDPSSNTTPSTLSFDGYSVTAHAWNVNARQAGSFNIDDTFQATYGYNGTAYLGWENADNGSGGSSESIGWTLMDVTDPNNPTPVPFNSNGNNYTGKLAGALSGPNVGPSQGTNNYAQEANNIYSANFAAQSCHTYEWKWTGIGGNDPIAVSVPFSMNSNDYNETCWNLVADSEASQTGTNSYQFNHRVGNQGAYQASYSWQVQGCYETNNNSSCGPSVNNGNWSNNCDSANNGAVYCSSHSTLPLNSSQTCSAPANTNDPPNYCPSYDDNQYAMVNYTFPSSAKVGDYYCQRIYYTDTDGPNNNSVAVTSPKCEPYAGESDVDASTSVSPTTTISGSATFTHTVSVNGSSNFSYQVEGTYCAGGVCNSYGVNGCGSQAPGCPALPSGSESNQTTDYSFTYPYSFPSGANSGDEYCQRLYVNPGNNTDDNPNAGVGNGGDQSDSSTIDGSTGWYNDGGACTTYNPPAFSGGCYEYSGTTPKSSSYNQDYTTATGPDGQTAAATSGRDATADIYISSNGGSTTSVQYRADSKDSTGGAGQDYTSSPMVLGPGTQSYDFTYFPNGTSVSYYEEDYVTVSYVSVGYNAIVGYDKNGNPEYEAAVQPAFTTTFDVGTVNSGTSQCYSASCTISNVNYGAFSIEGQQYTFQVTFTNNGSQILMNQSYYSSGAQLGYSYGAGGSSASGGTGTLSGYDGLTPGQSTSPPITITITAGNGSHYETPTVQMEYIGTNGFNVGPACTYSSSVDVYEPFNLSLQQPDISLSPTNEDPTSVSYSTQICNSTNVAVDASSTSNAYELPASGGQVSLTGDGTHVSPPPIPASGCINPLNTSESINPLLANAGDQYCDSIQADYTTGYVGAGGPGDLQSTQTSASAGPSCTTVNNEPYVQVFGNDVIGDAAFGGECGSSGDTAYSGIYTYSHATNGSGANSDPEPTGSYSQFGTQALSAIEGMSSAGLRASGNAPNGSMGLSFSNTADNSGGTTSAANLGGGFGPSLCEPDYYSEKPTSGTIPYSTSSISSIGSSGNYNYTAGDGSDTTQISSSDPYSPMVIPQGVKVAIFVDGNAYIDSNIEFAGADTGWSNIKQIPSLYIIATGNVYIDSSVTELDGVYIAEPNPSGSSTGIIDTCASSSGPYQVSELYGENEGCDRQLTVNGAFVDQATMLDRSFSSLRYSQADESPQSVPHNCGLPGQEVYSGGPASSSTCAAEIFNFTPDIYVSQPAYNPLPEEDEYITSLSPVL